MSLIFKTPKSENLTSVGVLILRIGLAFGFFWAGSGKVSDPAGFGGMLNKLFYRKIPLILLSPDQSTLILDFNAQTVDPLKSLLLGKMKILH